MFRLIFNYHSNAIGARYCESPTKYESLFPTQGKYQHNNLINKNPFLCVNSVVQFINITACNYTNGPIKSFRGANEDDAPKTDDI